MLNSRRRFVFAAFGSLMLSGANDVAAQDIVPPAPADVREFELKPSADLKATVKGEAVSGLPTAFPVEPAPEQTPVRPAAPPVEVTPPPAPGRTVAPQPTRQQQRRPYAQPATGAVQEGPAVFEESPGLPGAEIAETALPPSDAQAAAAPSAAPEAVTATTKPAEGGLPWLNILLGALAALAILFGLRERRRASRARAEAEEAAEEAAERLRIAREANRLHAKPAPRPEPSAPPPPPPAAETRPWIELEFKPETAAANDVQAQLLYTLTLRNTGPTEAGNVRVAARMFNIEAEPSPELAHFFSQPIGEPSFPIRAIAPGEEVTLRNALVMPRSEMRAIVVEGRKLFIPIAAFNVLYEWDGAKAGQTAMSYVVGRESQTPTQKMGPFRLDLGPRIYRSVGQRPSELARVA